jgi:monoamine oxidase
LPPQLAASAITFSTELPSQLSRLLPKVQTWMAGSIKFVLEYESCFWRGQGFSGMVFSHVGIVTEMHDHASFENNKFGFTGFLHTNASRLSKQDRQQLVLQQLKELFGKEVLSPLSYEDKIWGNDLILGKNPTIRIPHQNNGHPLLQKQYMNGKLFFSGTESSLEFPGYMEGAIRSAQKTFHKLL